MQKDRDMARRFREAANDGDVTAMKIRASEGNESLLSNCRAQPDLSNNLGVCYHTGKGRVKDSKYFTLI